MGYSKHSKYNNHSFFIERAARHQSVGHVKSNYFSEESPTSLKLRFQWYFGKRKTLTEAFSRKHASKREISTHVHKNGNFLENGSFNWKKRSVNVWIPVWASLVQVFVSFRVTLKEEY